MARKLSADDEADLALLALASTKRKFAMELGRSGSLSEIEAFERGIDNCWFMLVDVSPIAEIKGNRVFRIFRLTDAGIARLTELGRKQLI